MRYDQYGSVKSDPNIIDSGTEFGEGNCRKMIAGG